MKRRDKGYLIPENLHPSGRRCIKFYVPDDLIYLANFWGAVSELGKWFNYETTGDDSGSIVAAQMREVIETAQQFFDAGEECALPVQIRRNPSTGNMEWRPDSTATWIDLGGGCECTPDVAVPDYKPSADTDAAACAIATGVTEWIFEKYQDTIDQIESNLDAVSAFDGIVAIFSVPAYLIADQVMDVINEIGEAGVNAARAFDTVEHREEIAEWVYCNRLKGMTPPEMTEEIWEDWKAWMYDEYNLTGLGAGLFLEYRNMIETIAILDRAAVASHGEGNCAAFECEDLWEKHFDFQSGSQGWVAGANTEFAGGTFGSTVVNPQYANASYEFPAEGTVVQVSLNYEHPADMTLRRLKTYMAGVMVQDVEIPVSPGATQETVNVELDGSEIDGIEINLRANYPGGMGLAVHDVWIRGDGVNPFE